MKDFWEKITYLLDVQDRKNFIRFIFLLFIASLISSVGLTTFVLLIKGLADPQFIQKIPIVKNFPYKQVVSVITAFLIAFVWGKGLLTIFIEKKRSLFINNMIATIQKKLFVAYLYTPYFAHTKRNSSELVNNIKGEAAVLLALLENLAQLLSDVATAFILIIIVLVLSPLFTIGIFIPVFLGNKILMRATNAKSNHNGLLRGKSQAEFSKITTYGLMGIKEIKIYQKEPFFIDKAEKTTQAIVQSEVFSALYRKYFGVLNDVIPLTSLFLIILTMLLLNGNGTELLVSLAAIGVMASKLIPSLERIMRAVADIKYRYFALDKIYTELRLYDSYQNPLIGKNQNVQSKLDFHNAIILKKVFFSYGEKEILNDINLTLDRGKKIAFVGHSGAGKTTLVDIILGILTPAAGEIWVDQTLLTRDNVFSWYPHFGYIPQMIYVFDGTVRENIALGVDVDKIDDAQVWHCLEIASLANFVKEECPQKLQTHIGDNGIRLSGGQRQRIGIARALYNNPEILVMDEATAALDNQTEYEVSQALSTAGKGRTIITIAHRLTTIQHYDIIYVMKMGSIIASGSYQDLLLGCEVFQEMAAPKSV